MSPTYSPGVVTATSITGSSNTGLHFSATDLKASEPASLNAISEESTA